MIRNRWRLVLAGAGAAVGLTVTVADAQAERVRWKMHAAYASNIPIIGDTPTMMIETVSKASGGEFQIRHFEPGALVPGIQYYDMCIYAGRTQTCSSLCGFSSFCSVSCYD